MSDQQIILSGVLKGTFASGSMKSNANAISGHLLKEVPKLLDALCSDRVKSQIMME